MPTLRDVAQLLAKNEMSATEHVRATLDALDGLLGTPWENLVAARNDDAALAAAARADEAIAAGDWIGPLHGIAVAVKDNIDVAGMPTRCGSAVLAGAPPAANDARIVARLREAGAIVVAKTHLHEFAYGPTGAINASGPAAHPHDPNLVPGGSSSGSAALVAKGVVPVAIGTDTGCSTRTPASLCGIVGMKPSFDALPTSGAFPLSTTFDHIGLLAADVLDVSLAWGALPGIAHVRTPVAGLRVGRLRGDHWDVADPAIAAAVDAACRRWWTRAPRYWTSNCPRPSSSSRRTRSSRVRKHTRRTGSGSSTAPSCISRPPQHCWPRNATVPPSSTCTPPAPSNAFAARLFPGYAASWGWTRWSPRPPLCARSPRSSALGGSGGGPNPVAAHVHPVQRARHSGHLGTGTGGGGRSDRHPGDRAADHGRRARVTPRGVRGPGLRARGGLTSRPSGGSHPPCRVHTRSRQRTHV